MPAIDPLKMFSPIASFALLPHLMIVPEQVPAKTLTEFIAYAKANPGKLNYGAGLGTPPHLLTTLFKIRAGLDVTYVPYQGAAPAVTDLLAGRIHYIIDGTVVADAACPQRQVHADRHGARRTLARAAERADAGGERLPGFHARRLGRRGRAARNARADPGQAQRRHQQRPQSAEAKQRSTVSARSRKTGTPAEFGAFIADQGKRWGDW